MSHARLGPSNPRWVYCPGSVRAEEPYPDVSGAAAIDGTGSHLLLELCLTNGSMANEFEGKVIGVNHEDNPNGWLVSADRIERVNQCLNYVKRRVMELKDQHPHCDVVVEAESKSNPGEKYGRDDWWGTCDITISVMFEEECSFLEVIDYKDGRGYVSEKNNSQLISYLGGKLHEIPQRFTVITCRMTIVQPKTNPPVRYVDEYSTKIEDELDKLNEAASRTDASDAPLVPGKHCQWCKHKKNCSAEGEDALRRIKPMTNDEVTHSGKLFETLSQTFDDIETMTSEQLAEIADARPGIESIFDRVDAEIKARLEVDPNSVKGFAMQPGRSSRVWNADEEEIVKMLKARRLKLKDIYPPKLVSPAQVLKSSNLTDEQKRKIEEKFVENKPGKLTLKKVRVAETKPADVFADVAETKSETPSFF